MPKNTPKDLRTRRNVRRIYSFAYEGVHQEMQRPAIFLVHGSGTRVDLDDPAPDYNKLRLRPADADVIGVAAQTGSFAYDMKVWAYDQGDFTMRLDTESGPFEELLLADELDASSAPAHYSGARVSGARVRGARVSGARVRGARVGIRED